ncbi:MAG: DUF5060 domain-containing protein [Bacteroidales bacterium]
MKRRSILFLGILITLNFCLSSRSQEVEKFGIFETAFKSAGVYENPFLELSAEAELKRPDGSIWKIPLFWDGEKTWKLRVSPDQEGEWSYKIYSTDKGLRRNPGKFICKLSVQRGSIQPMNEFPNHFQYQNGDPVWFMGETAWALFNDNDEEKLDRTAFEHFVKTRASQGFNAVHSMMLSEAAWGNSGGMPFLDMEKQILNHGYWQEIDSRIRFANQHGLIVGLVIAWGDKNKKVPFSWRMFPDLEARKHYARYIAARYSAFNVYFIVSGEWHGEVRTRPGVEADVRNEFIAIGNALDEAEPHGRMIGIHPMNSNGSVREFNEASWMSFGDYQQNYSNLHSRILESMIFNKPVVNSEYGYHLRDQNGDGVPDKDNSTSLESIRHSSWDIVMAGGYLVTGFGTTYFGGHRDPGPFNTDAAKNDEWELQIGFLKNFFERLEYWKLKPNDNLLTCKMPRGKDRKQLDRLAPPSSTYWLMAEPGKQYVIYVRGLTEKIGLNLENNLTGNYSIQLFNPRTGEFKNVNENFEIKRDYNFTPPDHNDWLLYLKVNN